MGKKNKFSLTVIVMIFAIIAIFVGYFLGNWIIKMAVDSPNQEKTLSKNEQKKNTNTKTVEIDEQKSVTNNNKEQQKEVGSFSSDGYAIQVGAFNNYDNALSLKNELISKGFEVIITEGKPHKVRVGPFPEKEEAESIKDRFESLGYNGYVIEL